PARHRRRLRPGDDRRGRAGRRLVRLPELEPPLNLPSGVSEESFLAAVEKVSAILAPKYAFGPHDQDDIRQTIFVLALEALPRFEQERGGLEAFLYRHCANRPSNN